MKKETTMYETVYTWDYDEHTLVNDHLEETTLEDEKKQGTSEEDLFDMAYELFSSDDGNEFKSASIEKGILFCENEAMTSLLDVINSIASEDLELVEDFREYVKRDFEFENSSQKYRSTLTYDGKDFWKNEWNGNDKLITLNEAQLSALKDMVLVAREEYQDLDQYGYAKCMCVDEQGFVQTIRHIYDVFLNKQHVERQLWTILDGMVRSGNY